MARERFEAIVKRTSFGKVVSFEDTGLAVAIERAQQEDPPGEVGAVLDYPAGTYAVLSRTAALAGRRAYWFVRLDPETGVLLAAHNCPARAENPKADVACRHLALATLALREDILASDAFLQRVRAIQQEQSVSEATTLVPFEEQRAITTYHIPTREEISDTLALGKVLMETRGAAIPKGLDTPQKAAAVILAGRELGFDPMTSFRHIFVVDGQTQPDGQALAALMQRAGADLIYHCDCETCADVELVRPGRPSVRVKYTMEQAIKAGSTTVTKWENGQPNGKKTKPAWANHPADMLIWKAVARLARRGAADLINAVHSSMVRVTDWEDATSTVTPEALHGEDDDRPALAMHDATEYDEGEYDEVPDEGTSVAASGPEEAGQTTNPADAAQADNAGGVGSNSSAATGYAVRAEPDPTGTASSGPAWLDTPMQQLHEQDEAAYREFVAALKKEGQTVAAYNRAMGRAVGGDTPRQVLAWASGGMTEQTTQEGVRQ